MPSNTGTDSSRDEPESTGALAGKRLSPWLLKLMADRVLPMSSRAPIYPAMPRLASSLPRQSSLLNRPVKPMVRWTTDYTRLISSRVAHLTITSPALKLTKGTSTFISRAWQHLPNLVWFRGQRKRRSKFPLALNVTEEQLNDNSNLWEDNPHSDNFLPTVGASEGEASQTSEVFYPMATSQPLSSPMAREIHPPITRQPLSQAIGRKAYPMVTNQPLSTPIVSEIYPTTTRQSLSPAMGREVYPTIIKHTPSPATPIAKFSSATHNSYYPVYATHLTYASSIPILSRLASCKPEIQDTGGFAPPHVSHVKIPSIYQDAQATFYHPQLIETIESPARSNLQAQQTYTRISLVPANRQLQHSYQNRLLRQESRQPELSYRNRLLKLQSSFDKGPTVYHLPTLNPTYITTQSTPLVQAQSILRQPYPATNIVKTDSISQIAQHSALPHVVNQAEVIISGKEHVPKGESRDRLADLSGQEISHRTKHSQTGSPEATMGVFYLLPHYDEEFSRFRDLSQEFTPPATPKTYGIMGRLPFNLPILHKKPVSGFRIARASLQPAPEIRQIPQPVPLAVAPPKIATPKTRTEHVPEDSHGVMSGQAVIPPFAPDKVSPSHTRQVEQAEMPPIHRGYPLSAGPYRQHLPITKVIHQPPTSLPDIKSTSNISPPDRTLDYSLPWDESEEPSVMVYRKVQQPASEPTVTFDDGARADIKPIQRKRVLSSIFEEVAYSANQPAPELALAPVGRMAEATSTEPVRPKTKAEEPEEETGTPNIDDIARQVYPILRRRLAIERERMGR